MQAIGAMPPVKAEAGNAREAQKPALSREWQQHEDPRTRALRRPYVRRLRPPWGRWGG